MSMAESVVMRRGWASRWRRRAMGAVTAVAMLGALVPQVDVASAAYYGAPQFWFLGGAQLEPRTDGDRVVWLRYPVVGSTDAEVYTVDVAGGEPVAIRTGAFNVGSADVDGDIVVWRESPECWDCQLDVMAVDLTVGEPFPLASTAADEHSPQVNGEWVAWIASTPESSTVYLQHLYTDAAPQVIATAPGALEDLRFEGTRLAWLGSDAEGHWTVSTYDTATPERGVEQVHAGMKGTPGYGGFDLNNDTLVLIDGQTSTLRVLDLAAQTARNIPVGPYDQRPTTDGRYVIWQDHLPEGSLSERRIDLLAYDLETNSTFAVAQDGDPNTAPQVRDGRVVWVGGSLSLGDQTSIVTHRLADTLPTAARLDPGTGVAYFPETQHTLQGGFADYWAAQGGLPVFGYPLTEEYLERGADTEVQLATIYTERQRFEWHPENAGTAYEVLLGRLGVDLLAAQGRDWQAFPPAPTDALHYMPETQHAIGEMFYGYWSSHGLDLGDDGTSFRESLALFGFPISEPMQETNADGDTVLTQYFERAVFEWHPENAGTEYEVLLRRVGYELLLEREWLAEVEVTTQTADAQ